MIRDQIWQQRFQHDFLPQARNHSDIWHCVIKGGSFAQTLATVNTLKEPQCVAEQLGGCSVRRIHHRWSGDKHKVAEIQKPVEQGDYFIESIQVIWHKSWFGLLTFYSWNLFLGEGGKDCGLALKKNPQKKKHTHPPACVTLRADHWNLTLVLC